MQKSVEFYLDIASPPTYVAYMRMPGIVARTRAQVVYRIMLLGGIFKLTGNREPVAVPAKRTYMMTVDLPRAARRHEIPLDFHPDAPFDSLGLMRGAVVAEEEGCLAPYLDAVFRAMWAEARDFSDPEIAAEVLHRAGLDAAHILARAEDKRIKEILIELTTAAVARGVFGSPTFFVGDQMFFGQDRLDLVEEALMA
jgi:2-hydroxychromene-2-carboxylate isomerase